MLAWRATAEFDESVPNTMSASMAKALAGISDRPSNTSSNRCGADLRRGWDHAPHPWRNCCGTRSCERTPPTVAQLVSG